MRRALISDIHGNLEALEAVLEDIRAQQISEVFCLGDIVGFGPNPRECIDRVMETSAITLLGNHDAMLHSAAFNVGDERAILGMPQSLAAAVDRAGEELRREFVRDLPQTHRFGPFLFVHGSPRNPVNEYVFPEDIYNHRKMTRLFELVDRYCFHGHTHVPGIITEKPEYLAPEAIGHEYELSEGKLIVDVGSVGQSRDGDDRACYVILEDGLGADWPIDSAHRLTAAADGTPRIAYRRVPYDRETTIRKIRRA